jgi:NAD(P)-dependent dehydrogenase (short-subunit alcohol dehydrogenase family)
MTAIVTGAGRGIGRAIAERLLADHPVLLVDLDPGVERVAAELGADGVVADVTDPAGRAAILDAVDGDVSVLVNNAGITRDARIVKMTDDAFLAVIRVNLGAAYELTTALRGRFADGASVVSLASRAYLGNFGQFNYAASKGGLVGMTRALALELAPRVRVNAVAPSLTASEMTKAMPAKVLDKMIESIPMGRMGEPHEIADTVAALASPAMAYVTGQVVVACGGRSLAP